MEIKTTILIYLNFIRLGATSPVITENKFNGTEVFEPPSNICKLPDSLGSSGENVLLEECHTLDRFDQHPPLEIGFWGSSIYVCCPPPPDDPESIYFSGEVEDVTGINFDGDVPLSDGVTPSQKPEECQKVPRATCANIDQCDEEDWGDEPPIICGWDVSTGIDKVCCKKERTKQKKEITGKFGSKTYSCKDAHPLCGKFYETDPTSCTYNSFMRAVCMETCKRCDQKGCVDEFEQCEVWSRAGKCPAYPEFMAFNCRESCGTCGFRSVHNQELQIVNGKDYSDIESSNFFCGERQVVVASSEADEIVRRKKRTDEETDLEGSWFFSADQNEIRCGSLIVTDRFIVTAAHCYAHFTSPDGNQASPTATIRSGTPYEEVIDIRRVFAHKKFKYPKLYSDIAVMELGRRILFDFEKFGDSPTCLSKGEDIVGKIAVLQGFGSTETGKTSKKLLKTNVTIISNSDCHNWINGNITKNRSLRTTFLNHFDKGINDQVLCSTGIKNEASNIYSGPCTGDSGGPLFVNHGQEVLKETLEGIVSGGLSCGKNTPAWYTKVSYYRPWIECIIREIKKNKSRNGIRQACKQFETKRKNN